MGTRTLSAGFSTNAVLRNTYALLSMTLLWSAVTASIGAQLHWTGIGYIGVVLAGFATLFATMGLRNSGWGVLMVFAFTGLEGLGLGPLLQHYLHLHNGAQIVGMAAGTTGLAFMALSAFVLVTRKDFSFLSSFLFIGLTGLVLVGLFGMFFHSSALQLTLSVISLLVFSGYILMDTSRIVNGGERNYILATVSLYLDILNIFVNLLEIFGSGDD
jgi:modulator of FtsH protease